MQWLVKHHAYVSINMHPDLQNPYCTPNFTRTTAGRPLSLSHTDAMSFPFIPVSAEFVPVSVPTPSRLVVTHIYTEFPKFDAPFEAVHVLRRSHQENPSYGSLHTTKLSYL